MGERVGARRLAVRWTLAMLVGAAVVAAPAGASTRSLPGTLTGSKPDIVHDLGTIIESLPGPPAADRRRPRAQQPSEHLADPRAAGDPGRDARRSARRHRSRQGRRLQPHVPGAGPGVQARDRRLDQPADPQRLRNCPPTAVSVVVLPNGQILYWNGLQAEENAKYSIVAEVGDQAVNDQSRLLTLNPNGLQSLSYSDLDASTWTPPTNPDGGANGSRTPSSCSRTCRGSSARCSTIRARRSGALFCSRPGAAVQRRGARPRRHRLLRGAAPARHPPRRRRSSRACATPGSSIRATGNWSQTGSMHFGRWYPSLVTLGNGNVFVASGVTKLLKPVYTGKNIARLPGPTSSRPRPSMRPPASGRTTRPTRQPLAPAVPAAAPAARRPRLLRRRRPDVQPVRAVLRRGAVELRRLL